MATSERKVQSNRRNGKLGGVKTQNGKLKSCMNARKHDLFSKSPLIRTALYEECKEEYQDRLRQLEIDYPGEEVELVQSRFDLAWVDLETGRVRNYHRLMLERRLREAQSGLAKELFDVEEQLNGSKNSLRGYRLYMQKLESWKPDFSPEQIPKADFETILKSGRDVYDRFHTGKMTADNTMRDVLDVSALMPEPTVATFGIVCRCLLTLYQLTIGIVETRVEEQQLDYDRLLIRKNELPIELILPESEQRRMFEYEAFLQHQRDKIRVRIESIIDRRSHQARSLLPGSLSPDRSKEIKPNSGGS